MADGRGKAGLGRGNFSKSYFSQTFVFAPLMHVNWLKRRQRPLTTLYFLISFSPTLSTWRDTETKQTIYYFWCPLPHLLSLRMVVEMRTRIGTFTALFRIDGGSEIKFCKVRNTGNELEQILKLFLPEQKGFLLLLLSFSYSGGTCPPFLPRLEKKILTMVTEEKAKTTKRLNSSINKTCTGYILRKQIRTSCLPCCSFVWLVR